jgi:hypothetical protein
MFGSISSFELPGCAATATTLPTNAAALVMPSLFDPQVAFASASVCLGAQLAAQQACCVPTACHYTACKPLHKSFKLYFPPV